MERQATVAWPVPAVGAEERSEEWSEEEDEERRTACCCWEWGEEREEGVQWVDGREEERETDIQTHRREEGGES